MNVILQKGNFYIDHVNLLKKKKNTVIDGTFSKFTYSNEHFIMNGIYFELPIHNINITTDTKSTILTYQPYEKGNLEYLQYISNIELQLLDYYNRINNTRKTPINILSKKIFFGNIKSNIPNLSKMSNIITIKISGIWETDTEIGLAIKLMYNR